MQRKSKSQYAYPRAIERRSAQKHSLLFLTSTVVLVILMATSTCAQQTATATSRSVNNGPGTFDASTNLPSEPVGKNDLIGISVYDAPEFTRSVRVDGDGTIRLPMVEKHIPAAGFTPEELEKTVRAALIDEHILVDPIVSISVVEYRSRTINVVGEVKNPMTFQAVGTITLFDAISRAGGLTENAGSEIIVSSAKSKTGSDTPLIRRIAVSDLLNSNDSSANLILEGGELVRVPEAGHFYTFGDVKQPGVFTIKNGFEPTVLTALVLSGGLLPYPTKFGFIYRDAVGSSAKNEIPVELKKIIDHKIPDVPLQANDILYIPEATGRKNTMAFARTVGMLGAGVGTTLLYIFH
jgi:polysaccharide export outer membrane protein